MGSYKAWWPRGARLAAHEPECMRGDPVTGCLDECSCGASAIRREQKLQYRADYARHVAAMFARQSTKRLCETLRLALVEKAAAMDIERAGYVLAELQRRKERLAAAK